MALYQVFLGQTGGNTEFPTIKQNLQRPTKSLVCLASVPHDVARFILSQWILFLRKYAAEYFYDTIVYKLCLNSQDLRF